MTKNSTKKSIFIFLIALVVVFAACTGNKSDDIQTTPEITAEPINNLGKFVAVVPKTDSVDYTAGNEIAKQKIINTIASEKDASIDFEIIELDENNFTNDLNNLLSTSTYIDSITADYEMLSTYASVDGLIQPIDSLLETYGQNLYNAIDESYWKQVTYNGQIYGIPSIPYPEKSIMVSRSDMLYMFTTEPITTYSDLLAICRFYKSIGYEYPLALTWDQLLDVLAFSLRVSPYPYLYEGAAPYTFRMREESVNYTAYFMDEIKILYDNGYINPNIFTATEEQMKEEFMAGKSAIYVAEYDDLFSDRTALKSVFPNAEIQIIQPLTSRFQSYPIISGEEKIDNVLMITANSQNAVALITYLDWAYSSQLNYNMLKLGAYGEQVMYNPALNEYEYLNDYTLENKPYDGLYTLGLSTDFLYTPPTYVEYTIDIIAQNTLQKAYDNYMRNIDIRYTPDLSISEAGQTALSEYTQLMRSATAQYVKGEINIDEYNAYLRETRNNNLLNVLAQEIGVEYLYKINNPD